MGVAIHSFNVNISPKMSYGMLECATVMLQNYMLMVFFKDFIYLLSEREGKGGRKRGGETLIGCFSNAPSWAPGPQPRHVP